MDSPRRPDADADADGESSPAVDAGAREADGGRRRGRIPGAGRGVLAVLGGVLAASGTAAAHGAALRTESTGLAVPTWLFLLTGGGVVGASFLLASFATERAFVRALHEHARSVPVPRRPLAWLGRLLGLAGLALVALGGALGPADPQENVAILLVWVAWWAGFTITVYAVGNWWPALDPARTLAGVLPTGRRAYPARFGAWPAVLGLLALVYVEVVSPLATDAALLAAAVLGYVALSVAAAVAWGADWFAYGDPLSRVFRTYGALAPVQRTAGGLQVALPGARLPDVDLDPPGAAAFVVALLWATTYDGLVTTPLWADVAVPVVEAGVPPRVLYLVVFLAGFGAFYGAYLGACRLARRSAPTHLAAGVLARRFVVALVPIAAGYHLAHYLLDVLTLAPALLGALAAPLDPPPARVLVVPDLLAGVGYAAVVAGHLLAIWVAHAVAFRLFPGRLQAVRSQYALTATMVAYTMLSLWIVAQPTRVPPYL